MDNKNLLTNAVVLFDDVELRALEDPETKLPVIEGLAVPYERRSKLLFNLFYEKFKIGAFRDHLRTNPDVKMFNNHNTDQILARTKNNTLTLSESDVGISFRSTLNDTSYANDLMKAIKRGDIDGMSFGFRYITREWGMDDGKELLIVEKAELREISPVSEPAYEDTEVYQRSCEALYKELTENKRKVSDQIQNQHAHMRAKLAMLESE